MNIKDRLLFGDTFDNEAILQDDAYQEIKRLEGLVQEVRNLALEEAATVCVERIGTGNPGIETDDVDAEALECAMQIRALKTAVI